MLDKLNRPWYNTITKKRKGDKKMTVKELIDLLNTCENKNMKVIDKWGDELKEDDFCIDDRHNEIIVYTWGD